MGKCKWKNPSKTPTYYSWAGMFKRCYSPLCKDYKNYGRKGIKVCERWWDYDAFVDDMGLQPDGMTLDRIDGTKDYMLSNCEWATRQRQASHRSTNMLITYNGKTQTLKEWERETGIGWGTLRLRYLNGRSLEDVFYRGNLRYKECR
jgi:hypothetical protein